MKSKLFSVLFTLCFCAAAQTPAAKAPPKNTTYTPSSKLPQGYVLP